ncbi:unnamed protein product [Rodentolepis nana]|uniref:Methionine--tRNA ligase, cytoplasmic n=1 Tax=Rodentolepis nana TaxID=102285 RepID=A0A0R3TQY2_RODNA|nr:unnamed protein product [Rodentolepis nana]
MVRLFTDPKNRNCLAALAVAHKSNKVEILKYGADNSPDGAILETESGLICSVNSIVSFIQGVDLNSQSIVDFFRWESNVLKPSLKQASTVEDVSDILIELQNKLQALENSLSESDKSAIHIIVWADLSQLSLSGASKNVEHLHKIVQTLSADEHCIRALKDLSGKAFAKEPVIAVGTKLPRKQPQSANTKSDITPQISEIDHELQRLQIEVSSDQMLKAQWTFFSPYPLVKTLHPTIDGKIIPAKKDEGVRNILITSALPYVNNVPHLGNLIGSLLSANIFALYCRTAGYNVLSICGTDEYGTATETKALAEGLTPQQITDKYHTIHRQVYDWFGIHFDHFGRTSTPAHTEITQEIFKQLYDNGYISEASIEQLYCGHCEKFLADRFVEGNCPYCKSDDARGDQCDSCGKLINAVELIKPRCITCLKSPLEEKVGAFFKERTEAKDCKWTQVAQSIGRTWLRDGFKKRCITRDLKWGVPVPLTNFKNKVFYVWFDAPFGYMSITANYTKDWRQWWQPSEDLAPVEYYQFMAKDNVPFHACIFPASLLGSSKKYTLVKHIIATDYLNYEGKKFSKSKGVGVFGNNAQDSGIESNIWRFYLCYIRPETQDSTFSWEDFALKNNTELLNNLGNFINRPLMFVAKFFKSKVPALKLLQPDDVTFLARVNNILAEYIDHMENCRLREGVRSVLSISRLGNGYVQAQKPWVLYKSPDTIERAGVVSGVSCNIAALLGILLRPFMPAFSDEIFSQCQLLPERQTLAPIIANGGYLPCLLPEGHVIGVPKPLFKKIEAVDVQRLQKMYGAASS